MASTAVPFAERYQAAFSAYLLGTTEAGLESAYDLGRHAVAENLSLLDLTEAHHAALGRGLGGTREEDRGRILEAAAEFLRESLGTFEIARLGFVEAAETARLEHQHALQQRALADASIALNATLEPREVAEVVAQEAQRVLDAARAEARLEDPSEPVIAKAQVAPPFGEPVAVPLLARDGRPLGRLVAYAREDRPLTATDEAMLVQLAQMAAVAAENARLYARERTIAQTLQRSLLPPRLPDIPGAELGARYSAAGAGIEVGGDFYDVFPAAGGEWALTIGDICGKGPDAAAVTALARYTIRAAALYSNRPSGVLRLLSDAMLEQRPDGRFASVAYVRLHELSADGASLQVALGGHPPPLVLRTDGTVDSLGTPGTLLGIVPEPRLADDAARLGPGDVLVLYTDGVTDVRRGKTEVFGLEDLRRLLEASVGLGPSALAARIEEEVLRAAGSRPRDDVAVLTLAVRTN